MMTSLIIFQSTVHGVCPTDFTVNAREDIATDVTVSRDLSKCDSFFARRQDTSPLALITGMVITSYCQHNKLKPRFVKAITLTSP